MKRSQGLKRTPLKKFSKKRKEERKGEMSEFVDMILMFDDIWNETEEDKRRCYETGERLSGGPLSIYFHHILPKEKYPQYKLCRWNIVLVSWRTHDQIHRGDINKFPKVHKKYLELLEKHNNFELTKEVKTSEIKTKQVMDGIELSFGQKAVGIGYSPSANPEVDLLKKKLANVIDQINKLRTDAPNGSEAKRYYSKAISHIEDGCMNAVKGITWEY